MYCTQCGNENKAGMRFCVHCGAPLASAEETVIAGPDELWNEEDLDGTRSRSPWIWIVAAAGVLFICAGITAVVAATQWDTISFWMDGSRQDTVMVDRDRDEEEETDESQRNMEEVAEDGKSAGAESGAEEAVFEPDVEKEEGGISEVTATATWTPSPTTTPSPTPTTTPSPTPSPSTTPSQTPTSTPAPVTCAISPYSGFASQYATYADELGCGLRGASVNIGMAIEDFQRGRMIWRGDNQRILVLFSNNTWGNYADSWREGDPEFSCGGPSSPPTPKRGFGRLWCDNDSVRSGLGNATNAERGMNGIVQDFEDGIILRTDEGRTYVFLTADESWR